MNSSTKFTAPASKLWELISEQSRHDLLSRVWCGQCRHDVTITSYSGAVRSGNLLLTGVCAECHGDVSRLIELEDRDDGFTYAILGPPKLTESESMKELKFLQQEREAFTKRLRALERKSNNCTITKKEEAEFNRLGKKGLKDLVDRMRQGAFRPVRPNIKVKR